MGNTENKKALNQLYEAVKGSTGMDYQKNFDLQWEYSQALFPEDKLKVIKKYI
jgi:hypothetical protein